jgi:hypothetical protein
MITLVFLQCNYDRGLLTLELEKNIKVGFLRIWVWDWDWDWDCACLWDRPVVIAGATKAAG